MAYPPVGIPSSVSLGWNTYHPPEGDLTWNTSDRRSRLPADWDENYRQPVLKDAGYRCQIRLRGCLGKATDVDHKQPGDNHARSNLQAACERCHARKSSAEGNDKKRRMRAARLMPLERHPGTR
ncbi:HNH endonuclease [Mycobacterium phage SWU2]|uniref:HNH endonuclease n=1 Tax=Mycobacterium phage SWU2 TaxID=2077150 RepID=A0A2K9VHZ6_9CAUD|nr:HNH endonuclease [Mycobacterium phage SWU2]AUV61960.1 HNH endonuclease [Mycobacterium phage SWU2]